MRDGTQLFANRIGAVSLLLDRFAGKATPTIQRSFGGSALDNKLWDQIYRAPRRLSR